VVMQRNCQQMQPWLGDRQDLRLQTTAFFPLPPVAVICEIKNNSISATLHQFTRGQMADARVVKCYFNISWTTSTYCSETAVKTMSISTMYNGLVLHKLLHMQTD